MTPEPKPAHYTPASLEAFRGNPLIEALPDFLWVRPADIFHRLEVQPGTIASQASRRQRAQWLLNAAFHCFIPGMRHMKLYDVIDLMIRQGYMHRAPKIGSAYYIEAQERLQKDRNDLEQRTSAYHEPLTTSVIGCSGIGKSCGVLRVLSLYDQVIDHAPPFVPEPLRQVVYMKVEAPGTIKALCASIITELGRLVGIAYGEQYVKPRATLESLQQRVVYLMSLHRVGILVIDEMQNLVSRHKNRDEIFNFIVYLSNSLDVPILFIGTPRLMRFMGQNLRTARRFGSFGIANWERYERNTTEWQGFIRQLWKFQVLKNESPEISANIEDTFYSCSQGITDILVKLFVLSQMQAILNCSIGLIDSEKLTPDLIEDVFRSQLSNVSPIVEALRKADYRAIERYEDIAVPLEKYKEATDELFGKIVDATANMAEERQAKDAVQELDRRYAELRDSVAPGVRKAIAELMRAGQTPEKILGALANEKAEEGAADEACGEHKVLDEGFDPPRAEIK